MKNLELLSELLETSASACENFIISEIALNDGNVELSQKASRDGQQLLKTLIKDTFLEFKEEFDTVSTNCLDYDYPNNMELIKALNSITKNGGALLGCDDEKIVKIIAEKLQQSINTAVEIYINLFENWI